MTIAEQIGAQGSRTPNVGVPASALERTETASSHVTALQQEGWAVEDSLRSVMLSSPAEHGARHLAEALSPLLDLASDAELRDLQSGFVLGLASGQLEVRDSPEPVEDYYSGAVLDVARRARDGEIAAALELPGEWTASARIDLARPLRDAAPGVSWRVAREFAVVVKTIGSLAWWEMASLLHSQIGPLVCVVLGDATVRLVTATWAAVSPEHLVGLEFSSVQPKKEAVVSASAGQLPEGVSLPEELLPNAQSDSVAQLVGLLRARAAASAWAWLANTVTIRDDAGCLEFFGLQRVNQRIGRAGLDGVGEQQGALNLYRWATDEESVDRILAVRQIVSVYHGGTFIGHGNDVWRAAEPVYRALRSAAVAEVFAAQRQAHQAARDAARQSADAVLASAKSVAERTLATLAGVGGLVLAQAASKTVSADLIAQLAIGIALFALGLALWSIFIEGPTISLPLKSLETDLPKLTDLLSDAQRDEILKLRAISLARRRAYIIRVATPVAYAVVAGIALWVAYPLPTGFWSSVRAPLP